jgi:hypothetical protein
LIKLINSIQYHVWSDALHARQLAKQSESPWDRGAYVRWAIQTAWGAFESVCVDVLKTDHLGMSFRKRFDEAVARGGWTAVDWGQGLWQRVLKIYDSRKKFAHVVPSVSQADLLVPTKNADEAIDVLREAIRAICILTGNPHPPWVSDDSDHGWKGGSGRVGPTAHMLVVRAGANEDDLNNVRIAYVLHGKEHVSEILPPGTDHKPFLDQLLRSLNVPVDAVRAYRGFQLVEERSVNMRT